RIANSRTVYVMDHRYARQGGCEPANERRPRRMRVQQAIALALDESGDFGDWREVEAAAHRHVVDRRLPRLPRGRERPWLEACKAGVEAEFGQPQRQQVLYPLGPRVMLAVDQVQHADQCQLVEGPVV